MPFPVFDKKEDVPESMREAYVEREGKWHPDVEDVTALKSNQRRLLDEKKKQDDELARVLGSRKLSDIEELLRKQAEAEDELSRKKGDIDTIAEKRVKAATEPLLQELEQLRPVAKRLADLEFAREVGEAAIAAGVNAKKLKTVLKIVDGDYVRRAKDGKLIVVDEDGDPTGQTLEKFFGEKFKKDNAEFYAGTGASGGGSTGGNGSEGSRKQQPGTVDGTDDNAMRNVNIDDIASGKIKVVLPE